MYAEVQTAAHIYRSVGAGKGEERWPHRSTLRLPRTSRDAGSVGAIRLRAADTDVAVCEYSRTRA